MKQRAFILALLTLSMIPLACNGCGPRCPENQLVAPSPVSPAAGDVIPYINLNYLWTYPDPGCSPGGYHLLVSEHSDFSAPVIDQREASGSTQWFPQVTLEDCKQYHWKVAAIVEDVDGPFSEPLTFYTDTLGVCFQQACEPSEAAVPIGVNPPNSAITSQQPQLSWGYDAACNPDEFLIQLSTFFDFEDPALIREGRTSELSYIPAPPLSNATRYYWRVAPVIQGQIGEFSESKWFYTGPACTSADQLAPPELLMPEDGQEFSQTQVYLHWQPGQLNCIPDGYYRDMQFESDFSGLNLLLGYFDQPTTTTLTPGLTDCRRYYWRIAAVQDGIRGPFSTPGWFSVDLEGDCLFSLPVGEVMESVNCRVGPQIDFAIRYVLIQGDFVEILGRNLEMTSYAISLPGLDQPCWAAMDFIVPPLDPQELPILPAPSIPIEVEVQLVCRRELNQQDCEAAGGEWKTIIGASGGIYYCDCP